MPPFLIIFDYGNTYVTTVNNEEIFRTGMRYVGRGTRQTKTDETIFTGMKGI